MERTSIADVNELEEGEIENDYDFDEVYVPLERPSCNVPVATNPIVESDNDDNGCPSSSDSDSLDGGDRRQRVKKEVKSSAKPQAQKSKNWNIWCKVLEGESVASNLTDCNLDESQRRIRGLVPYDYSIKFGKKHDNEGCLQSDEQKGSSGKRNYDGNFVGNRKVFKDFSFSSKKGASKSILPLSKMMWDSNEMLAKEIAEKLSEVKQDLILKGIEIAGKERIIKIFEETRDVERDGGMLIMNGSRRRTSGGVFFYLLKTSDKISDEEHKLIFQVDPQDPAVQKKKLAKQLKRQQAARLRESAKTGDSLTAAEEEA